MTTSSEIYIVQKNDTLSRIADKTGVSLPRLVKLNGLKNPNLLQIGQPIYLSERAAFSVKTLFLDALRCPIENLAYQLVIDGKAHRGKTSTDGMSIEKITAHAKSTVEVLVKDALGNWHKVGTTVSGYGEKLITLISPYVLLKDKLEPHPAAAPTSPQPPASKPAAIPADKPALPPKPQGSPTPNNPNVKKKKKKGKGGESVIEIGIDLPDDLLKYMQAYEDTQITEADWKIVADGLTCEINVLKAIAKVESGGRSAFWVINDTAKHKVYAPKIMFERHYFHRLTCANGPRLTAGKKRLHGKDVEGCKSPHDIYPDICWPVGYRNRKKLDQKDTQMHDDRVDLGDIRDNSQDYLRLINAYRLNKEAALKSASWGKFQIMGANYSACGERSVKSFVEKMCRNEVGQIELLAGFIKKNAALWKAVKEKNWHLIAYNYNGPNYKNDTAYNVKMKEAYEYYCKNTA